MHYKFINYLRSITIPLRLHIRSICSNRVENMELHKQRAFTLSDYDAIGFDLDHTICKYKLKELFHLIYENMATFLVEKRGYSKNLYQSYETGKDFIQKGIIFDKQRGNFLKLSSDYTILQATHGTHLLTMDKIMQIYGKECIWQPSTELPEGLCHPDSHKKPYYVFRDYFVLPVELICARLIDIIDNELGPTLQNYNIWPDIYDGIVDMYKRTKFQEDTSKGFFYNLTTYPEKYLVPRSQVFLSWLYYLKQQKKVFLLTSASNDFAAFLATFCLGEDWKKYFDISITYACKPSFFTSRRPFLLINDTIEGNMISGDDLKIGEIYSQGNWQELHNFFGKLTEKRKPNILYIGDSYIDDVFAPSNYTKCKTVAIIEEMKAEDTSEVSTVDDDAKELASTFWKSFFAVDVKDTGSNMKTLWSEVIKRHSKLGIPNLDVMTSLSVDTKLPFEEERDFVFFSGQSNV